MTTPSKSNPEDLFQAPLEIDEDELLSAGSERGKVLDISDELRLLAKQNHLSLFKIKAERRSLSDGRWLAESELCLKSLAHPDCHFIQAMLTVSLEFTPGAKVLDMQPEQGQAHQIKISESHQPSFEAEIPGVGIKATLGGEKSTEQTFDRLVLTGYNGEDRAIWSFKTPAAGYELTLNVPLKLQIEYPSCVDILRANVEISARIGVRGWADFVPLIRRKSGKGESPVYLDR